MHSTAEGSVPARSRFAKFWRHSGSSTTAEQVALASTVIFFGNAQLRVRL